MEPMTFIFIALAVFVIVAMFIVMKKVLKVLLLAGILLFLATLVIGFLVIRDAKDFRQNLSDSQNLYLLINQDQAIAGLELISSEKIITYYDTEKIQEAQSLWERSQLDELAEDNYKLFIVDHSVLEETDVGENPEIPKDLALELLLDDSPIISLSEYFAEQSNIPQEVVEENLREEYGSDQEFKGVIFQGFLTHIFATSNLPSLIGDFKAKRVIVHPDSAMFKFIRYFPSALIKRITKSALSKAQDAVD